MNLKHQSKKLEVLFEKEVKQELPVALLPDGSMIFKDFKIKQNKKKTWDITRVNGFQIDTFNLKACALMAAKLYSINRLVTYNEVKLLDQQYQNNTNDSEIFKHRYTTTADSSKKDLFLWRWEITKNRAKYAKQQITSKFRSMF
jgi:hypothetical protein